MDFLLQILEELRLPIPLSPDSTLQDFWRVDVEFELMTQADESGKPHPVSISRTVLPELRAADYLSKPFPLRPGEELILAPDPAARAKALRLARRWAAL